MEGHLGRYTSGDAGGTFAIAHAGIDRLVGSNLLVGIAVQYDRVDREGRRERTDEGQVARISADGWMAGPYLTARLDDRIYLDAGIGIGTATNRITMSEGGVSGTFDSRRFSAHATLLGDLDHGGWTIRPKLGFSWYGETAGSWTGLDDSGGAVTIPEVDVSMGGRELREMGFRKLSARPRHHAQDPDALAAFKKSCPAVWRRSGPGSRQTPRSSCGGRTKPA